jgi:hypothetical protein
MSKSIKYNLIFYFYGGVGEKDNDRLAAGKFHVYIFILACEECVGEDSSTLVYFLLIIYMILL